MKSDFAVEWLLIKQTIPDHYKSSYKEFRFSKNPVAHRNDRGYSLLSGYVAVANPVDGQALRHILSLPGMEVDAKNKYGCTALWQAAH